MTRVAKLTAERDEIDKKREIAEYTCSKYAEDLRVARSEAIELQRSMVSSPLRHWARFDRSQGLQCFRYGID